MLSIINIEFLKLKRSKILYLIPAVVLFPCIIVNLMFAIERMYSMASWDEIMFETGQFFNIFAPVFCVFITGSIFTNEVKDGTIAVLYTYPVSRLKIMISKMLIASIIIFITFYISFGLKLWFGLILTNYPIPKEILYTDIKIYLGMMIMNLAMLPAAVTVSILGRNEIITSAFATGTLVMMQFLATTRFNVFFPWSIPLVFASKMGYRASYFNIVVNGGNLSYGFLVLSIMFTVLFVFNCFYYKNSDIE